MGNAIRKIKLLAKKRCFTGTISPIATHQFLNLEDLVVDACHTKHIVERYLCSGCEPDEDIGADQLIDGLRSRCYDDSDKSKRRATDEEPAATCNV